MKRRITRLAVWLLTVVLLVSCTGCMDSVPLKSRTIIKMVGIDREEEQYLLTLLYFAAEYSWGKDLLHLDAGYPDPRVRSARRLTV